MIMLLHEGILTVKKVTSWYFDGDKKIITFFQVEDHRHGTQIDRSFLFLFPALNRQPAVEQIFGIGYFACYLT